MANDQDINITGVTGLPTTKPNPSFSKDTFKMYIPKFAEWVDNDGEGLYNAFSNIADQKIIKNIWNVDWEYAMSLCIAHYLATVNRESEVSFGRGDIARDSGPRGLQAADRHGGTLQDGNYKNSGLQVKYDFKNIMVSHNESKFWNSTEFGRILMTLLYTKAIPTMVVVN